jgi:hypothetical protein
MSNLILDLQDEICSSNLNFQEIAEKHSVPVSWVQEAYDMLFEEEELLNCDLGYNDEYEVVQ